jgi:hypothetical protein
MIHKICQYALSLNTKHFLGLGLILHEILTYVLTKKLNMFLLLHNHALNHFLIQKRDMGNKLSLSLLFVSLVSLSHFFDHILIFLESYWLNDNDVFSLDRQLGLPLDRLDPLPLPQRSESHLLLRGSLDFLQDIILIILVSIITCINFLVDHMHRPPLLLLMRLIE